MQLRFVNFFVFHLECITTNLNAYKPNVSVQTMSSSKPSFGPTKSRSSVLFAQMWVTRTGGGSCWGALWCLGLHPWGLAGRILNEQRGFALLWVHRRVHELGACCHVCGQRQALPLQPCPNKAVSWVVGRFSLVGKEHELVSEADPRIFKTVLRKKQTVKGKA